MKGDGVRRNKRWALHWFERAAVDTPEARKAAKTLRESWDSLNWPRILPIREIGRIGWAAASFEGQAYVTVSQTSTR